MATSGTFAEQVRDRSPDWKGRVQKRFRWSKFRFEYGRWCYVVHPWKNCDVQWWEWENP